jgi:hypothetical protein
MLLQFTFSLLITHQKFILCFKAKSINKSIFVFNILNILSIKCESSYKGES